MEHVIISGAMDDIMLSHNGEYTDMAHFCHSLISFARGRQQCTCSCEETTDCAKAYAAAVVIITFTNYCGRGQSLLSLLFCCSYQCISTIITATASYSSTYSTYTHTVANSNISFLKNKHNLTNEWFNEKI